MTTPVQARAKKRSTAPFWIMVAIFAAPVIAAWFLYFNPQYLPSGRTNQGALIDPVVSVPRDLQLQSPVGEPFDLGTLEGKWTLVYLAGGECDDHCRDRLIALRQIRLALGESQLSVERLLLMLDPAARAVAARLGEQFDGMHVALSDLPGGGRLKNQLGEGDAALDRIYLLDPMGNLMMRYASDSPAEHTLADMEHLLKASKSWIKGAQYGHQ